MFVFDYDYFGRYAEYVLKIHSYMASMVFFMVSRYNKIEFYQEKSNLTVSCHFYCLYREVIVWQVPLQGQAFSFNLNYYDWHDICFMFYEKACVLLNFSQLYFLCILSFYSVLCFISHHDS